MIAESFNPIDFILGCVLLYNVAVIGYDNNEIFNFIYGGKLYVISVPKIVSVICFLYVASTYRYFAYFCMIYRIVAINNLKFIK
jgi:hypothetical protein